MRRQRSKSTSSSASANPEEGGPPQEHSVPVDADFKDADAYDVFFPEGSDEPWHVVVGTKENDRFVYWALIQMLQSKDWEADFEWAVFMKTGRSGSSGLRHFSKKFTDGAAALRTFAEWFSEKTGNKWLGDFTSTKEAFVDLPGKFMLLTPEVAKSVLEHRGDKERERPKLGTTDLPVDIYFKDRSDYQVYVTPDDDLWTAVMSVQQGDRHSQYAIMQVLVAKPDIRVEFDFVVFMRHGKLGGSAQRYAKRYTVEVAALSTFHQWFKEKTGNEWLGSFKDTLECFAPVHGKYCLLPREEWSEVVEFEERARLALVDSDVPVDFYYRDRDSYRVYHTEGGELWAAVLAEKGEGNVYKKFVLLQMLAKREDATVDFDYVVLRRVGERGESGQWTAKKFTNELDALRTFKLWYRDETGCTWQGSYSKSFDEFVAVPGKMSLLPIDKWDDVTREVTFGADSAEAMIGQALKKSAQDPLQSLNASQRVSVDVLKKALSLDRGDGAALKIGGDSAEALDRKASAALQKAGSTSSIASGVAKRKSTATKPAAAAATATAAVVVTARGDSGGVAEAAAKAVTDATAKQDRPKRASSKKALQQMTPGSDSNPTIAASAAATDAQPLKSVISEKRGSTSASTAQPTAENKTPRKTKKSTAPSNAAGASSSEVGAAALPTAEGKHQPAVSAAPLGDTVTAASAATAAKPPVDKGGMQQQQQASAARQGSITKLSERTTATGRAPPNDDTPDPLFTLRARYTNVVSSVRLSQTDKSGKARFYVMQLLEDPNTAIGSKEKFCFYVRTGKAGTDGGTNFKTHASLDAGRRSFAKKFEEKTKNEWLGDVGSTLPSFAGIEGEFQLIST